MSRRSLVAGASLITLGVASCQVGGAFEPPQGGLQRMIDQPRYDAFAASGFFDDQLTMRQPPDGTVPFGAGASPAEPRGVVSGEYVARVPLTLTPALLELGRERYDIVCATCHGVLGAADTPVARNMELRPPPALVTPPVVSYPAGRIYEAIREGYGFMPSYAALLSIEQRWAVVAYVKALQRSQNATLADVPADVREQLRNAPPADSASGRAP